MVKEGINYRIFEGQVSIVYSFVGIRCKCIKCISMSHQIFIRFYKEEEISKKTKSTYNE